MSEIFDQTQFMSQGNQNVDEPSLQQEILYDRLMHEEFNEFCAAEEDVEKVKEAVDVLVVTIGYLISKLGWRKASTAWEIIWRSNMAKVSGVTETRVDGKILQNDDYKRRAKAEMYEALRKMMG